VHQLLFRADASQSPLVVEGQSFRFDGVDSRRRAAGEIQEILKRVPDVRRHEILAELEARLSSCAPASDASLSAALTWDEVREMSAAGIEFGSHTVTHPILLQLNDLDLARELHESKSALDSELSVNSQVLAYPVGKSHAYDDRVIAAARAAQYRLGVAYITGMNSLDALPEFGIKRIPVERYMSRAYFMMMLGLPGQIVDRF
jgi:hypothetical protein